MSDETDEFPNYWICECGVRQRREDDEPWLNVKWLCQDCWTAKVLSGEITPTGIVSIPSEKIN